MSLSIHVKHRIVHIKKSWNSPESKKSDRGRKRAIDWISANKIITSVEKNTNLAGR